MFGAAEAVPLPSTENSNEGYINRSRIVLSIFISILYQILGESRDGE